MNFAKPEIFVYLWLLPILIVLLLLSNKRVKNRLEIFSKFRISDLMDRERRGGRVFFKGCLVILTTLLVVFALAQPRFGFEWKELPQGGVDIMVVLDVSKSMKATDLKPTRMERAKREIIDLLEMLQGDRIGVVAFAGVPFVQCPLTRDYRMAKLFISQISTDLIPVQGTNIGGALNLAVESLHQNSFSDSEGKAIILITDGEDHDDQQTKAVADAQTKGIKIFTIGIGAMEGAPIPQDGGGFKKDALGNMIITKLNEEALKTIAINTGGAYARSVTGEMDLENIYIKGIRESVNDQEFGMTRQKVWYERFQWFILFGLVFLVWEFFTDEFRKRRSTAILLFAIICGGFNQPLKAADLDDAKDYYQKEEYDKAEEIFMNAEVDEVDNQIHTYNRATSQYQNNKFEEAAKGFAKSAQSEDATIANNSLFNLGNSLVGMGKLEEASQAYQQLLKKVPEDIQAKENLGWVKTKIEKQKEKEKKEDPNGEEKGKKEDPNGEEEEKSSEESEGQAGGQTTESQKEVGVSEREVDSLLRSVEGKQKFYGVPPKFKKPKNKPKKDW